MGDAFDVARAVDNIRMMLTDPASYPNVAAAGAVIAQACVDEVGAVYSPAEVAALGAEILNGAAGEGARALAISVREKGMPDVSTPPADPTFGGGGGCASALLFSWCGAGAVESPIPDCTAAPPGPDWCQYATGTGFGAGTETGRNLVLYSGTAALSDCSVRRQVNAPVTNGTMTAQFDFCEAMNPTAVPGNHAWGQSIQRGTEGESFVYLDDGGFVAVRPSTNDGTEALWTGTWTPAGFGDNQNAMLHRVHWTVDGALTPRLWVDGVEIALTNTSTSFTDTFDFDAAALQIFCVDMEAQSAPYFRAFVTPGVLNDPDTDFCCP